MIRPHCSATAATSPMQSFEAMFMADAVDTANHPNIRACMEAVQ